VLLVERLPRRAPAPLSSFWIETSARKISFVRARCSNAGKSGGAERARQFVMGVDEHLLEGYQRALRKLRPAWVLAFWPMSDRKVDLG
jgi:hypothetical protein